MIEHILKASLDRNRIVCIIYHSEKGISERNIKVLEIHDAHIKAYCYRSKGIRTFKLSNILSAFWCVKHKKVS